MSQLQTSNKFDTDILLRSQEQKNICDGGVAYFRRDQCTDSVAGTIAVNVIFDLRWIKIAIIRSKSDSSPFYPDSVIRFPC